MYSKKGREREKTVSKIIEMMMMMMMIRKTQTNGYDYEKKQNKKKGKKERKEEIFTEKIRCIFTQMNKWMFIDNIEHFSFLFFFFAACLIIILELFGCLFVYLMINDGDD